jgi:hypothetical protein
MSYVTYDFLGKKVQYYSQEQGRVKSINGQTYLRGGRIVGFGFVLQDITDNPLIGKGLQQSGDYDYFGEIDSRFLNSIFTITSSMGLFGIFWYFFFMFSSSIALSKFFKKSMKYGLVIIIVLSSYAFNIHYWGITFIFLTFGYFSSFPNKTSLEYSTNIKEISIDKFIQENK